MRRLVTVFIVALIASLGLAAAPASAAPVPTLSTCKWVVTPKGGAVNVRSGPGTNNSIIQVLYPGRYMDFWGWSDTPGWAAVGNSWNYHPIGFVSGAYVLVQYKRF